MNGWTSVSVQGQAAVRQYRAALDAVYFTAKNRSMREPSHYTELMDIHRRIVFTRAFVAACFVLVLCFSLLFVIQVAIAKACPKCCQELIESPVEYRQLMLTAGIIGLYVMGFFLSREAYEGERKNFDARAVGYYISIKTEPSTGSE